MKLLIYILFFLTLASCSSTVIQPRLYGRCGYRYYACHQFKIKRDKTFEYYIFYDVGGGQLIKGTWQKYKRDTILLNTFKQPKIAKTYYIGSFNINLKDSVKVIFPTSHFGVLDGFLVMKDSTNFCYTNTNGVCYLKKDNNYQLKVYDYYGAPEIITISDTTHNTFEIFLDEINEYEIIPTYLINEKVILKRNKIIMEASKNDTLQYSLKRNFLFRKTF